MNLIEELSHLITIRQYVRNCFEFPNIDRKYISSLQKLLISLDNKLVGLLLDKEFVNIVHDSFSSSKDELKNNEDKYTVVKEGAHIEVGIPKPLAKNFRVPGENTDKSQNKDK